MKLSVSNLAWGATFDEEAASLLKHYGVNGIDLVPGRYFSRPWEASVDEWVSVSNAWRSRGFELVGMQSLLFGLGSASIFGTPDDRKHIETALLETGVRAAKVGVTRLVFGSPRNRLVADFKGDPVTLAAEFFYSISERFSNLGIVLLFEPNGVRHGCDFVNSTAEAIELSAIVNSKGFGVNFDFGAEQDSPSVLEIDPLQLTHVGHAHLSNPSLTALDELPEKFKEIWRRVKGHTEDWIAIEQLGSDDKEALDSLMQTLETVRESLGD
jgi:sugar phosphate isomerase/epimerase